jgi:hypothetical protein
MVRVKIEAPSDQPTATGHSQILGASSPLVGALGDLGVASASLRGLVRVTMYGDAAKAMSSGAGRLMTTLDGQTTADVVDKASGRIVGKGRLSDPDVLSQISPAIAWTALAYVVGQHFQHEISERLGKIESRLGSLDQRLDRQTNAELSAATKEVARMAGRLLDGEPAERVDSALNSQIHCIETRWQDSLHEIDAIERQLLVAQGRDVDVDALSEFIPDVFGEAAKVSAVVQRFFDAMQARLQLIAVRTSQAAAASAGGQTHFQQSLSADVAETKQAWLRVQELFQTLSRLQYSVRTGRLTSSQGVERAVTTTRVLLDVADLFDRIEIPMITERAELPDVLLTRSTDGLRIALAESSGERRHLGA